jgi:integrase
VLEQLRGLFGYAVDHHLLTVNPAAQVRATKIIGRKESRARALSGDEIRRYLAAVEALPTSQANRIAFRLILLTLCRKGELVKARKEHLDLKRGEWLLPPENTKNRQEHLVYLSSQARALFEQLLDLADQSPWLLPGRNPKEPISHTALNQAVFVAKNRAKTLEWLGTVWIHDLRRTASTHLHDMGWPSDVIERALNHTIRGVRGVYNRALYADQRREMLQAWADYVDAVCAGADVKPIRRVA